VLTIIVKGKGMKNKFLIPVLGVFFIGCGYNPVSVDDKGKGLIVSEIMYNRGVDTLEFIEFKNTSSKEIDLSGMFFSDGLEYTFPDHSTIGAGNYLVLTNSIELFKKEYPGSFAAGAYKGRLNDNGEKLTLCKPDLSKVLSIEYKDGGFWPAVADGLGFSIVPVNEDKPGDQKDASDWRACSKAGGSPGKPDPYITRKGVLVNEVVTSTNSDSTSVVELYNPDKSQSMNVGGWFLTDDKHVPEKYRISQNTVVKPDSFVTFTSRDFGSKISVSISGGQIYIFSAGQDSLLTGYSHGIDFDASEPGTSFGLIQNSDGKYFTARLTASTAGTVNSDPLTGDIIISELMYHPVDGAAEFIEILNRSDKEIVLYDEKNPENRWKIGGISFVFPGNIKIKTGEKIVLIDSTLSISEFRAASQLDSTVQIFQYAGKLSNNGETISVEKPGNPFVNSTGEIEVPYVAVDVVSYKNNLPWPPEADGQGYSIIRIDPAKWGNEPGNWKLSDQKNGTPGL
jgi:hypothetical protein